MGEIGARITMELVKIEELVNDGKVLYHRYVNKTEAEIRALQQRKDKDRKLKDERRVKQELNVQKREEAKKEIATKKLESRKEREVAKLLKSFDIDENAKDDEANENDDEEENVVDKKKWPKKRRGRGVDYTQHEPDRKKQKLNTKYKNKQSGKQKKR